MGWLYTQGITRKDLIDDIVKHEENESGIWKTLCHCTRGNVLWMVKQITRKSTNETELFIGCYLLGKSVERRGNRKVVSWGYKDMSESIGPNYYTCPLSYLDQVPVANEEWREQVRKYHRTFQRGDRLLLKHCKVPHLDVISVRPLRGTYGGTCYRVPRDLVDEIIPANQVGCAA